VTTLAPPASPNRLRALVVDDEQLARRNLTVLLERDRDIGTIEECASGMEAVTALRGGDFHLVFLDVQMPECDGFDVLEILGQSLGAQVPPAIIFVTAYQEHAIRAFEAGALDYLLKPFDDARVERALHRAKDKIAHYAPQALRPPDRIVVKRGNQVLFLDAAEIDWIEAAGYYACLHVGEAQHILRRPLAELQVDLGERFARIHRSVLVNLERIRGLDVNEGGESEVVLKSGERLRLSRRFRKGLQERLGRPESS
jgi:two-component system, LytTR family, response regulator